MKNYMSYFYLFLRTTKSCIDNFLVIVILNVQENSRNDKNKKDCQHEEKKLIQYTTIFRKH